MSGVISSDGANRSGVNDPVPSPASGRTYSDAFDETTRSTFSVAVMSPLVSSNSAGKELTFVDVHV